MRFKTVLALAALAALMLPACRPSGGHRQAGPQRAYRAYHPASCPPEVSSIVLVKVTCGTLVVPAHHAEPGSGRLRLFVARLHPGVSRRAAEPILFFGGDLGVGPDYPMLSQQAAGLGRDVIVLNVRGTGLSEPGLACPEADALARAPVAMPAGDVRTRAEFIRAITACRERLISQGVDLTAFDLREMAADAEDLRIALRIGRWDVMALGTASRIALEYLRDYQAHVRAAVLDGAEWPGVDPFVESVQATRHAIAELSSACSADATCTRLEPNLAGDVGIVTRRLAAHPRVVDLDGRGRVVIDAGWFMAWLRARLAFIRPPGSFVPHAIALMARGSARAYRLTAIRLANEQLCAGFLPNCWPGLTRSLGVYLSVMCRDVVPFTDAGRLSRAIGGNPGFGEAYGHSPYLQACQAWNAGRGSPVVAAPVRSDVPTLVLAGRFDPFGMPPYARAGAAGLADSHVIISPVNGHVVTGTEQDVPDLCMVRVRDAWLANPTQAPDASCRASVRLDYTLGIDYKL
jgi:pimeloyl-ACP methyl ester carboxylesterase